MSLERGPLLADESRTGASWCRAHSDLVDAWLSDLLHSAADGATEGVALVGVGGYGRSELCPESDIDVTLVLDKRDDIAVLADRVWYPIWDEGYHLGHRVGSVRDALALAASDLDTATALLSARHIAGDPALTARLATAAAEQWERRSKQSLTELGARVELRHEKAGEVAFRLEPDLKEGRGGLRDVHALRWAEAARRVLLEHDDAHLAESYGVLLDARVELQRRTRRPTNLLALQEQDGVAAALGLESADALMAGIAEAARAIAWTSDDTWRRLRSALRGPLGRIGRRTRTLDGGISLRDGEVYVDGDVAPDDPTVVLRAAVAAAGNATVIDRASLERLSAQAVPLPDPWPPDARPLLVDLLLTGRAAVPVIEALDQRDLWTRIFPEWEPTRARPQRNAYHRFTVDRHLLETAANAARLAGRVDRPDLLVIAALLHDLGKGHPGDHTDAGVELMGRIGPRMGLPADDVATLTALVEHHLLLADVATRRDLDDPAMIERVAHTVGSTRTLNLLAALTEADSLATGPSAWSAWKAELVGLLVDRARQVFEGGEITEVVAEQFPTREQLARLMAGGQHFDIDGDVLTVMTDDRPRIFSRVAGVLALHGLDVLVAAAHSSDDGRALAQFRVTDPVRHEIPWPRVIADLERALAGRLAIQARLAERVRTYGRPQHASIVADATVTFHNDASESATVVDVRAPDGIGVLYRITNAMGELDLDIRSAKVQTLGAEVVDAFYVRDGSGSKITDLHACGEIERAIEHSLRD